MKKSMIILATILFLTPIYSVAQEYPRYSVAQEYCWKKISTSDIVKQMAMIPLIVFFGSVSSPARQPPPHMDSDPTPFSAQQADYPLLRNLLDFNSGKFFGTSLADAYDAVTLDYYLSGSKIGQRTRWKAYDGTTCSKPIPSLDISAEATDAGNYMDLLRLKDDAIAMTLLAGNSESTIFMESDIRIVKKIKNDISALSLREFPCSSKDIFSCQFEWLNYIAKNRKNVKFKLIGKLYEANQGKGQ